MSSGAPGPGTPVATTAESAAARARFRVQQLGDARRGKLAGNMTAFGRALRRAGVRVDPARIALAQQAVRCAGVERKADVGAALETVLISREADRGVFRELFAAFFRDPELARKLLAQMLPKVASRPDAAQARPRVREALQPAPPAEADLPQECEVELDAAMTASATARLRTADFNQLTAGEYRLVERLVRDIPLQVPMLPARRTRSGARGARLHWARTLGGAARTGGDVAELQRMVRRRAPLPLLVLVDVSGSMERYARLLLAFLHAATARARVGGRRVVVARSVFAFGTGLTDLTRAFRRADTDAMLLDAGAAIQDFGGGTRLGDCLAALRRGYARRLVGGRTLVLVVSDGLDTGEPAELARELGWLQHHARRILWLNPLLRFDGYAPTARGAAVLHEFADAMLAVHNVARLQQLAGAISTLMRQ